MAVNTSNTILKYASTEEGPFAKLIDITSYPDLGSEPNKLDTTDLSDTRFMTSILGLQEAPDLTFEANYTLEAYELVSGLVGEQYFQLEFGPEGVDGKFAWKGDISVFATGGGVDEVRGMTVTLSASTPIELIA